jgi:hypothetical protein
MSHESFSPAEGTWMFARETAQGHEGGLNPCLVRRRILLYLAVGHQLPTGVLAIRTSMIIVGHAGSRDEDAQYPPFNREANLRLFLATYTRERVWEEVCNRLRNIVVLRFGHCMHTQ